MQKHAGYTFSYVDLLISELIWECVSAATQVYHIPEGPLSPCGILPVQLSSPGAKRYSTNICKLVLFFHLRNLIGCHLLYSNMRMDKTGRRPACAKLLTTIRTSSDQSGTSSVTKQQKSWCMLCYNEDLKPANPFSSASPRHKSLHCS